MMNDALAVAASPTTVWRILRAEGRLDRWNRCPSRKGQGFQQPLQPHEHWHVDIAYINVAGTFYYLIAILDGASRYLVGWDLREHMTEQDVELVLEKTREAFPGLSPRIISDNGSAFVAKDFKSYIRLTGMTHVRTSPYYPQSNGKIERWNKTIKTEAIRLRPPSSRQEARVLVATYVAHYNTRRLHSAIGYVTPKDRLEGRHEAIQAARLQRLHDARERRAQLRQAARLASHQPLAATLAAHP